MALMAEAMGAVAGGAVAGAWALVPLLSVLPRSVQQWQPHIITAGPLADITPTRPAIS